MDDKKNNDIEIEVGFGTFMAAAIPIMFLFILFSVFIGDECGGLIGTIVGVGGVSLFISIVIIYKFYSILKAIYLKLDSFDIPEKQPPQRKEVSLNETEEKKKEPSVPEESLNKLAEEDALNEWKEKTVRNIKAGIASGKVDEARGEEMIRRVQAATEIPVIKK